ncbi:MAG: peptidase M16 [Bacteroidetes bacterium CG2_30_32_10]|nr:MAG: peptidase M16 [Bacteroidetes bacterium CG2_30_32_10]
MLNFDTFELTNGLKVIVHKDTSTPIVAVNVLYNVGSRDEHPEHTGFAHLFEHLMFGGSKNIPKYDEPLQRVGGENNAFTSSDITNFYLSLPKQNLETAFWLESDRMFQLTFSEKSLKVQRNVVCEEFRQVYLNQPYGDLWLLLKPLAYKVHPYQWTTIGKNIEHIQNATMEEVKAFFKKFYVPNNAILTVAGNVETSEIETLAKKWFEPINRGEDYKRNLPIEPTQKKHRELTVERNVPYPAIYKAYHMCARNDEEYHTTDIISDLLSNGKSSRLHKELVKKQKLFSDINAYISGDIDKGLFIITGKLVQGVKMEIAEKAIDQELDKLINERVNDFELNKTKNKIEATMLFSEMNVLDKAMNLAYYEVLGNVSDINRQIELYNLVTPENVNKLSNTIFNKNNCSTLYYLAKK